MTIPASNYTKTIFPNGLRLITVPFGGVESATLMILVGVGSRFETAQINGISHFLEHVFFKGSSKWPTALDLSVEVDRIGGEWNAFTTKDHTGFYIKAASQHLPLVVDILSDVILRPKLDPDEIEREKGVILEEIKMRHDTPMVKVEDYFEELIFGDNPLGWTTDGRIKVIQRLGRKDFLDYLEKHYRAESIVVVASGKVNPKATEELIKEAFTDVPAGKTPLPQLVRSFQKKPAVAFHRKKTDQTHLVIGVKGYPYGHPKHFPAVVLTTVLGRGMSSRLFLEVREKRGLAYYIGASMEEYQETGYLAVSAGVDTKKLDEVVKVVLNEFSKLRAHRVGDPELQKAKEYLKGRLILSLENSKSVAASYASFELLEKRIWTPAEIINAINLVTPIEVCEAANETFVPRGLNLTLIGPKANEEELEKILESGL